MRGRRNPQTTMLAFIDLDPIEPSFDPTVFTMNRERLLKHQVGQQLFDEVVGRAHSRGLLSDEHVTVDGTLIEATDSLKRFERKDRPPESSQIPFPLAVECLTVSPSRDPAPRSTRLPLR